MVNASEYYCGLKTNCFCPRNSLFLKNAKDKKSFEKNLGKITKLSQRMITLVTKVPKKGKEPTAIEVFYVTKKNGIEVCKIGSKELGEMYTDQGWLSQQIIDAYLLYLVAQDINRYSVRFHMTKYVPTCFFEILHMDNPENVFYTDKMHHLFLKNVNTNDYDGFIFGGRDSGIHFFTVVLFLDKKEVFIFDPLEFPSTVPAVAKFLQLLFQYSDWLDTSGDGPTSLF